MNKTYALLLKTGESEIRAVKNLSKRNGILPIIELTRGRTSKKDRIGLIEKKINQIHECFSNMDIILDLTAEKALSNGEIDSFYIPREGYKNWTNKLIEIKKSNKFKEIYPTIILNINDPDFNENLDQQVKTLVSEFNGITYRCNIEDEGFLDDLEIVHKYRKKIDHFFFVIDSSYIRSSELKNCTNKSIEIIKAVSERIKDVSFIITSTSFPDKMGSEDHQTIPLTEINLYNNIINECTGKNIVYGDYGSINPIRNDNVMMVNGWRPRIDIPLQKEIYYYRTRKRPEGYSKTYSLVANEAYCDENFPEHMADNWGISQVINAADGASPGASPAFWISVRMNIHIEQQMRRLKLF